MAELQELFLRAHILLHPEGAAIAELQVFGVSPSRILNLYPYELKDWLPALTKKHERIQAELFEEQTRVQADLLAAGRGPVANYEMIWRGIGVGDAEMHGKLRGIQEELGSLPGWKDQWPWSMEQAMACADALRSAAGITMLHAMGFEFETVQIASPLLSLFSATNEMIALASHWEDFSNLHAAEAQYRTVIEAALNALLPDHFEVTRTLVRYDTMMFNRIEQ